MSELSKKRVLIVEDDSDTGELLRFTFENEGYSVLVAQSAIVAEEEWGRFSPHVVVTDYMMPGKTGLELLHYLRARVLVPVIIYTAYPSDHLKDAAGNHFAEVIMKGELEKLVDTVKKHAPVKLG